MGFAVGILCAAANQALTWKFLLKITCFVFYIVLFYITEVSVALVQDYVCTSNKYPSKQF